MDYKPNVDAVLWFYHQIFPLIRQRLPHLRFSVVGGHPPEAIRSLESDPAVDVTGYVDDIRPHVRACGLVVLPIRICSGILNKLLQSLALGVPVVATNMSLEGLDVVSDRDLLVADSPEAIADGLVRLATDQDLRLRLTSSGRAYVERVHQWSTMVAGYEEELKSRLRTPDTASGHTTPVFARASRRLS
jgi:glycosyltransferase involved in cell wall biosynthesis